MEFTTKSGYTVTIADFRTRKTDREYNEALMANTFVNADGTARLPAGNMQTANDILVRNMTGLSQTALDVLSMDDYNEILAQIQSDHEKKSIVTTSSEA